MASAHRWYDRRRRRDERRRARRGGPGRGPVPVQRAAFGVVTGVEEVRYRVGRAVRGDRPLVVALLGVLVLGLMVLAGPTQSYLDARERVDALEAKAAALDEANEELGQRAGDLNDPANIELLAREQQGYVRPGEVAYSVVPPEVDRPRITTPRDGEAPEPPSWYERAWRTVAGWFGT